MDSSMFDDLFDLRFWLVVALLLILIGVVSRHVHVTVK